MTKRNARKLARGFDTMVAAALDGLGRGDAFDSRVESYRVDAQPERPAAAPTAISDGGGAAVEWWQLGETILGFPRGGEGRYRIPLIEPARMPTVQQGAGID